MRSIELGGRAIGPGHPIFITVEAGTTSNGNLDTAFRMIDAAKEAGADAIKFMFIEPDSFMSDRSVSYEYEWAGGRVTENMYEMFKGLQFTRDEWRQVRDRCKEVGILFYATVDYLEGIDLGEELGVPAYKLSSWDARHFPLAQKMGSTGKPVQVDCGPTTVAELEMLLATLERAGTRDVILVHCSHAKDDAGANVRSVPYLQQVFGLPSGYSADSRDFVPDIASVALGTHLIEKRLTLDKNTRGHHHIKALEPSEFKEWVTMIRRAEAMLGEFAVIPSPEDLRQKELYFVSLVADRRIPAGSAIEPAMITCKRPGTGLSPALLDVVVGRKARRDIEANELITWDMI